MPPRLQDSEAASPPAAPACVLLLAPTPRPPTRGTARWHEAGPVGDTIWGVDRSGLVHHGLPKGEYYGVLRFFLERLGQKVVPLAWPRIAWGRMDVMGAWVSLVDSRVFPDETLRAMLERNC